ncbi:FAA hydrolase family-domain-containing protein [Jimgerdemannia flammicorona]|uniref:FAA hydrolase family-domain-containing protein n=1 Tax=Jimgerdemannia flammicorona TaxID=994334 RepID=A0A433DIW8_9FUNG|nr:FAA hydrolase family-domain-containing protein [Jimgerdemannia flammicorona]
MNFARSKPVVSASLSSFATTRRFFNSNSKVMAQVRKSFIERDQAAFEAPDGKVYNGQPVFQDAAEITTATVQTGLTAHIIDGDAFGPSSLTDKIVPVKKLLAPFIPNMYRCIGLNYRRHAEETKKPIPQNPILFIKPSTSVQNPFDPIYVPAIATNNQVDYESELAVVIGKPAKDVSKEEALDYVAGKLHHLQRRLGAQVAGYQPWVWPVVLLERYVWFPPRESWLPKTLQLKTNSCTPKLSLGFDTFAPLGPMLVSPKVITDPNNLRIGIKVNGTIMQDSNTSDMSTRFKIFFGLRS